MVVRGRSPGAIAGIALVLAIVTACADPPSGGAADDDLASGGAESVAGSGEGTVHRVTLVARLDEYSFVPAEVVVREGEVVRFVHTGHRPESVAFVRASLPVGGEAFLGEQGALDGPLLTAPGDSFEVSFRGAPAGDYAFVSVPHRERGMRGVIRVTGPGTSAEER